MSVPSNLIPTRVTQLPTPSASAAALQDALVMISFNGVSYKVRIGDLITAATRGTFSAGATGLTPTTPTSGDVTLGGVLGVSNGGTGAADAAGALANLGGVAAGSNSNLTALTGLTGGVSTPEFVQFDTAIATPSVGVGKLQWDPTWGCMQVGMAGGNVNLQIGEETLAYVYNNTGSPIAEGQVVKITGAQGQRLTVALAQADSDLNSATILGMATESIANNASGFITTQGLVNGVNTHGWADGTLLYLSPTTAGGVTSTKPIAPQHLVWVGYVVKGGSTGAGSIYIHTQNGYELNELHDVRIIDPLEGQVLRYDATAQVWVNSVGATVDVTGNAAFTTVRVTDTLPTVSPGVFFEYSANTATLRSSSDDPGNTGYIQFAMTNNDGTLTRVAYFDGVGNFYTPGQIAGGFLTQSTFNTVDQQLHLYTVVQNLINANVTMTTDVATLGSRADIIIVASGTTSRTVTFGTGFKTTGTLATGTVSGKYFVISFVSNGNFMIETSRTAAM